MKRNKVFNVLFSLVICLLGINVWTKQLQKPIVVKPKPVAVVEKRSNVAQKINPVVKPVNVASINITYGVSTHQNKRPYQEDRFAHTTIGNGQFFGIYDGHGGAHVSERLAQNLHNYFVKATGTIKAQFIRAFDQIDYQAQQEWPDEGSTALAIFIKNNELHFAWVGDTRAVLERNDKWALPLTIINLIEKMKKNA